MAVYFSSTATSMLMLALLCSCVHGKARPGDGMGEYIPAGIRGDSIPFSTTHSSGYSQWIPTGIRRRMCPVTSMGPQQHTKISTPTAPSNRPPPSAPTQIVSPIPPLLPSPPTPTAPSTPPPLSPTNCGYHHTIIGPQAVKTRTN